MAACLEKFSAALEEAVEFVDQEVDGLVGVFRGDAREEVGAANFDMAFGDEYGATAGCIVFEVDPDAVDSGLVAEEAFGFAAEAVAKGVGEGEVDTAKKDLRAGVRGVGVSHAPSPTQVVAARAL